ncbi:hypothetical protein L6164_033644 [Bauhinia variegata]|uniref:Uncharacterized protein n=1 Tax=Bauhinia variegata TaxID=167791 RepID=A0ACB9KSH1_BAUVA|nr:hypothetical protein L6164_033644 [Bauhinia variegata]
MKLSAKPISSPGRTEKFPPPLMRFLRSNVGSRSRGRSRSSPMFVRKKSSAIETQEPTSPKVTCMGQVRVRRSSKQATAKRGRPARDPTPTRCRCRWIRNTLFCHRLTVRIKPSPCQPVWPKWGFFRMSSFRRKASKVREDSTRSESNFQQSFNDESEHKDEELEDEDEQRANANADTCAFACNSSTPPKNALLLTRCRSAPYRSSSLASRFWGSPTRSEETGEEQRTKPENTEQSEDEKPTPQRESISDQEGETDPKPEEKLRFFKELEDSIRKTIIKSENVEELKRRDGGEEKEEDTARPLVLTRCKSEPARTGHRLDPQINFWKREGQVSEIQVRDMICD